MLDLAYTPPSDDNAPAAFFTSTKSFWNLPCAHRQWRDDGACALVHGYSRSFHFTFGAIELDMRGWVVDFGGLGLVKKFLESNFDHTLLLNGDDPLMPYFIAIEAQGAAKLVTPPYGVSMEGTARWVTEIVDTIVQQSTQDRAWVEKLEVRENDKNSAIYRNPKRRNYGR